MASPLGGGSPPGVRRGSNRVLEIVICLIWSQDLSTPLCNAVLSPGGLRAVAREEAYADAVE